jgi:hypothetical protein
MTTKITTLQSTPGKVTFTVWTNGGCDEDFEASIGGSVHLTLPDGSNPDQWIGHNLEGPYEVVITAKTSGTQSDATPLNLTLPAKGAGQH